MSFLGGSVLEHGAGSAARCGVESGLVGRVPPESDPCSDGRLWFALSGVLSENVLGATAWIGQEFGWSKRDGSVLWTRTPGRAGG